MQLALQIPLLWQCMELFKIHNSEQLSVNDFIESRTISGFFYRVFINRNVKILVDSEAITIEIPHCSSGHFEPYYYMVSL